MYYAFDIDWKSMPLSFALIGEADIRSDQWWAKCRSTMLSQIRQHFSDDDIDEKEMLRWFEEFQHKYCERRGHRLVPTPTGTMLVKLAYEELAPYRGLLETMSELENEVKKLPELYRIYEVISNVMDIYDNYCLDLDEILVPSASQTPTTLGPAASPTAMPTEIAALDKPVTGNDAEPDLEELGEYFRGPYRGFGGNRDYFTEIIDDTMKLSTAKEVGMVAHLLFHGNMLNNKKPRTFSKWIRIFFRLLGKTPPTDTHKNKYKPDEGIRRSFAYLP